MKAILTSYLGGSYKVDGKRLPGPIFEANGEEKRYLIY